MQGYNHALTGAVAWLAITTDTTTSIPATTLTPEFTFTVSHNLINAGPEAAIGGAILTAGAALLCDTDHHDGTIAHSLPPLTQVVCSAVEGISGGHRHGTHSLVGISVFTFLAWLLSFWTMEIAGRTVAFGAGLLSVFLVAFALKGLKINLGSKRSILGSALGPWIVALGTAGAITYYLDYQWTWLPVSVAVGTFVHCLGDSLTTQGVPWLWPANPAPPKAILRAPVIGTVAKIFWQHNGYFRFHVLGNTNSVREVLAGAVFAFYLTLVVFNMFVGK